MSFSITTILYTTSLFLILLGLFGAMTRKNLLRLIISLDVIDLGVNIFLVTIGYVKDGRTPIYIVGNGTPDLATQAAHMVDPVPQALVLTSIVIGFGVTAMALTLATRLYERKNTLEVSELRGLKW
jgi:multisubunit Na+/H+ antiporter MnhC subunit